MKTLLDQSRSLAAALAGAVAERRAKSIPVSWCALSPLDWQSLLLEVVGWGPNAAFVLETAGRTDERSLFLTMCGVQLEVRADPLIDGSYGCQFAEGR